MPSVNSPTLFYYVGAEDARWMDMLIQHGVKRVVLNYGLMKNQSHAKIQHLLTKLRGNGVETLLDPAIGPFVQKICDNHESIDRATLDQIGKVAEDYIRFVKEWKGSLDLVMNLDFDPIFVRPSGFRYEDVQVEAADGSMQAVRNELVEHWDRKLLDSGVPVMKVWHQHQDLKDVRNLKEFSIIALRNIQNKTTLRVLLGQTQQQGVKVHAIGMGKTEWLDRMGFYSTSLSAWLAGKMFGQTYVWDGRNIVSYNKEQQIDIRRRYADHFKSLGLNPEKIIANDVMEVCKANLRAWMAFEKSLHMNTVGGVIVPTPRTAPSELTLVADDELDWDDRDTTGDRDDESPENNHPSEPEPSEEAELDPDSGFGGFAEDDEPPADGPSSTTDSGFLTNLLDGPAPAPAKAEPRTEPVVHKTPKQLALQGNNNAVKGPNRKVKGYMDGFPMLCDGCVFASRCPKFKEGATCGFRAEFNDLNTDSAEAALQELHALAQAQKARVMKGLMFENLLANGMIDKNIGQEIDRMTKLLEVITRMRKEMSTVSVQIGPNGIFAQLFGPGMFDPQRVSEQDGEIIEVEVEE